MATKITIANQKGGVGKSTTALSLANGLLKCGYRVLIVDTDPQCNTTTSYKAKVEGEYTFYDLLQKNCTVQEAIQHTDAGDIIASDKGLSGIESTFAANPANYYSLKNALLKVDNDYDFVVIDTPPGLGFYMMNSLIASNGVIIPIRAEKFAIDGLSLMFDSINSILQDLNPELNIYGVLLTTYDKRNALDVAIWEQLPQVGEDMGFRVFSTPIRICQKVKDAQSEGTPLFDAYPSCNAAIDYANAIKELMEVI